MVDTESVADRYPRTRLQQLAWDQRLLTADEFRLAFEAEAARQGEKTGLSRSQARRWLHGEPSTPRAAAHRVLVTWLREPLETLFGSPVNPIPARMPTLPIEERLVTAGHESADHALRASSVLDPSALENLHAAVVRAAHDYYTTPSITMHTELVALRDTLYCQLDRTNKPRQQAELYVLAGQVCGLLSSVSLDLGDASVSDEQARAAYSYGCIIDHPTLQAWARALQATIAFWSGRPRRAVHLTGEALLTAPPGSVRAQLHGVRARALGMIGARDEILDELAACLDQLDQAGNDPFIDSVGGEMQFDHPRRAVCAGAAWIALGDGERAESEVAVALELFAPNDNRRAGALAAQFDLATARTLRGDLAGASEALDTVIDIELPRRTERLAQRAHDIGRLLGASRYRGAVEATSLGDALEHFTATSLPRVVARPALPAGG